MEPHTHALQQPKECPQFSDQQLDYIILLARRDAELCSFVERADNRAPVDLSRTAIVGQLAYRAATIVTWRRQKAQQDAIEAKLKARLAETPPGATSEPRIAPTDIPELKESGNGNGTQKAE